MPQHQSVTAPSKPALEGPSNGRAEDPERSRRANLGRHTRKCAICNHPDRDSIESDIISWRSASTITLDYALPARSSIYRHAAATGLLQRRQRNLRGACERIIERVDEAPPSASAVLRALRIYAQITEDGHWLEPAKRSVVTHVHITKHEQLPAAANHGGRPEDDGARSDEIVEAGLSRQHSLSVSNGPGDAMKSGSLQTERTVPRQAARIENSREGVVSAAESAAHDNEQPSPKSTPAANERPFPNLEHIAHWARGLYPEIERASARAKSPSTNCPKGNRENDLAASPPPEILIATQNASREEASSTEQST